MSWGGMGDSSGPPMSSCHVPTSIQYLETLSVEVEERLVVVDGDGEEEEETNKEEPEKMACT